LKVGIIDLGTNTFNLLIAELDNQGGYKPIYRSKVGVKLGEGSFERNYITEAAMERAFVALEAQITAVKNQYCDKVLAFATSAVRNASNGKEFVIKVKDLFGINIHVIDGDREAAMIYNGVQLSGALNRDNCLIMDIGGGSTEFIVANDEEILWKRSYELGVSRLLEKFKPEDPISDETLQTMESFLENEISEVFDTSKNEGVSIMIGSSGSFDTFSDVIAKRVGDFEDKMSLTSYNFDKVMLDNHLNELIRSNRMQREAMDGMVAMRVNMIVMSAVFVRLVLKHTEIPQVKLSKYSLKEGVLFEVLKGNL
jgi:exopolyphosphatase/guanosine-5'-triphosphate,3'-diphosphate pyrophosphatase